MSLRITPKWGVNETWGTLAAIALDLTMLQSARKKRLDSEGADYATNSDFCAVFLQQLDSLYLLALLLTGDELSAEKCFLTAFDSCVEGSVVFKERAVRWSRRTVVKSAIKLISPATYTCSEPRILGNRSDITPLLQCVQELPAFDRFVFVMSVLERYSDRECALLLGCSYSEIPPVRSRAYRQLSRQVESNAAGRSQALPFVVNADYLEC